jgi:hypothetical protein
MSCHRTNYKVAIASQHHCSAQPYTSDKAFESNYFLYASIVLTSTSVIGKTDTASANVLRGKINCAGYATEKS